MSESEGPKPYVVCSCGNLIELGDGTMLKTGKVVREHPACGREPVRFGIPEPFAYQGDDEPDALAPFRALVAAYPHEVDGWLVTHTEPGLTLGDVRRLVGEGR